MIFLSRPLIFSDNLSKLPPLTKAAIDLGLKIDIITFSFTEEEDCIG